VTCDSRAAGPGSVFVALQGEKLDGHRFVRDAGERGCLAAVVERSEGMPPGLPLIKVADSHRAYGLMAAEYFGHPARNMQLVGITGTNGKTTCSWLVEQIVKAGKGRPGVIGTVNYRYQERNGVQHVFDAPLTTPEPMVLQRLLREMNDAGVTHVILEVSSHSLAQQRLAGMLFDVAVFTNLSRDHLDYHVSMEAYFSAKRKLFDDCLKSKGIAVVCLDKRPDGGETEKDWGHSLVGHLKKAGLMPFTAQVDAQAYLTCGGGKGCMVRADKVRQDIDGLSCEIFGAGMSRIQLSSDLIGRHNISNMLTAASIGVALEMNAEDIRNGLQRVHRVPGRLERVKLPGMKGQEKGPRVFVDYAHTPDALENVLLTLRPVTPGRLFCVFGCGGDRDRGKRPMMGSIAASISDGVLLTSDNPRSENPEAILAEIEQGVQGEKVRKVELDEFFTLRKPSRWYAVLGDRRQAIQEVCGRAEAEDVVLIAGKGHETYQITAGGRTYFDDRIEAANGSLRWKGGHLLAATSGRLEQEGTSILLGRISTDTRTLEPGDVFVALRGENFDGHDYVTAAIEKGAAAVVVEEQKAGLVREKRVWVIRVRDTLQALGDLAHYRRSLVAPEVKVIGITGSSGKTTVKEMTASILSKAYENIPGQPVLKTKGNLNNLIGLPLSLLNIDAGHRVAVMEMGMNRPGEIERLTRVADPDVGCITNVQAAHLEGLGSIEGVARAKGELFATMSGRGIRVVNLDDPHVRELGGEHGDNTVGFAVTPVGRRFDPVVRATRIVSLGEHGMRFTLHVGKWRRRLAIPATGMHNVANCAAAAAIATAAGIEPETIARGLVEYTSGDKRLQIARLPGGIHVVNDSYNANPSSMTAALKTVSGFGTRCRRVALLGDMLELGTGAADAHRRIGKLVAELGFDYLGVTGQFAGAVAGAARESGMQKSAARVCADKESMVEWVADLVAKGNIGTDDWLLIKGSRGMRMEQVLQALQLRLASGGN